MAYKFTFIDLKSTAIDASANQIVGSKQSGKLARLSGNLEAWLAARRERDMNENRISFFCVADTYNTTTRRPFTGKNVKPLFFYGLKN